MINWIVHSRVHELKAKRSEDILEVDRKDIA